MNLGKSGLTGVNVNDQIVVSLAESIGCARIDWSLNYLGVPLMGSLLIIFGRGGK